MCGGHARPLFFFIISALGPLSLRYFWMELIWGHICLTSWPQSCQACGCWRSGVSQPRALRTTPHTPHTLFLSLSVNPRPYYFARVRVSASCASCLPACSWGRRPNAALLEIDFSILSFHTALAPLTLLWNGSVTDSHLHLFCRLWTLIWATHWTLYWKP